MKITALFFGILLAISLLIGCTLKTTTATGSDTTNVNVNIAAEPEGTPASASAESPAEAAAAVVADLYKQHDSKKSPFLQTKNRGLVDKYFVKALADLIWKDATTSSGEVGAIDGDPLYNAQDTDIKNFAIGKPDVKNDSANVPVTFTNFGQKVTINFALKQEKGTWKIENILYGSGDSLMKWLKDTYSGSGKTETSSTGEFEGKFTVGPTFCVVKPVKLAFDVKWAKGSGAETFVYTENNSFESTADDGGTNRFAFDDENYNTGTFYRADGKTFPVSRAR